MAWSTYKSIGLALIIIGMIFLIVGIAILALDQNQSNSIAWWVYAFIIGGGLLLLTGITMFVIPNLQEDKTKDKTKDLTKPETDNLLLSDADDTDDLPSFKPPPPSLSRGGFDYPSPPSGGDFDYLSPPSESILLPEKRVSFEEDFIPCPNESILLQEQDPFTYSDNEYTSPYDDFSYLNDEYTSPDLGYTTPESSFNSPREISIYRPLLNQSKVKPRSSYILEGDDLMNRRLGKRTLAM